MYVFQGSFTDVFLGFLTYDPETEKEASEVTWWESEVEGQYRNTDSQAFLETWRGGHQHVILLLPVYE